MLQGVVESLSEAIVEAGFGHCEANLVQNDGTRVE